MNSFRKIAAISKSTSLEIIYDKVFVVILIIALLIILSSRIVSMLTPGQELKLVIDIGLSCIYLFSLLIAVFSGAHLINREIERSSALLLLTKPIQRHEFILGKYFGLILTIFLMIALMLIVYIPILLSFKGINNFLVLATIFHKYIEVSLVAAFALFFSSFCKPVMGIILTFFVHISGILVSDLEFIAAHSDNIFFRITLRLIHNFFPNFNNFNIIGMEFTRNITEPFSFFIPIIYGILYIILVLTFTTIIFKKRTL